MEETTRESEERGTETTTQDMRHAPTSKPTGAIEDVGCLDLRYAKTAEDLSGISSIQSKGACEDS